MKVNLWKPTMALWWREMVRFVRQRSRIFGALGQPVIFWFLLGGGLGGAFQLPASMGNVSYLQYLFPGILILIVLFTAIFSTISIIEDRQSGFLQSVLVAPMPRSGIVLGKVLGGTTLALIQSLILLVALPFMGMTLTVGMVLELVVVLFVLSFTLTSLGYVIAWPMESTQGFHSIMNVFLIPMWLLSGAFFPAEGLPKWLSWIMVINPLTYGMDLVRSALDIAPEAGAPSPCTAWIITLGFLLVIFTLALWLTRQRRNSK